MTSRIFKNFLFLVLYDHVKMARMKYFINFGELNQIFINFLDPDVASRYGTKKVRDLSKNTQTNIYIS